MLDGFQAITSDILDGGTHQNLDAYRNKFSPFSRINELQEYSKTNALLVDSFYGHIYDDWVIEAKGLYGITGQLPLHFLDDKANMGFLRIPFAQIPRICVCTRLQIEHFVAALKARFADYHILLRGQTKERVLPRDRATRERLYGDSGAIEPSLIASASRHGINVDMILPAWCGFLRFLLDVQASWYEDEQLRTRFMNAWRRYQFSRFAVAIAQHYGLPSVGLDATTSIDVALFFATRRFDRIEGQPNWCRCVQKTDTSELSVIYVFAVPTQQRFDFDESILPDYIATRPKCQSASFLHRGWRFNTNDFARWLVLAMYLDPNGDFDTLPSAEALFPDNDTFDASLEKFRSAPGTATRVPELAKFLNYHYRVRY
jgi:hypothetical protein